MTADYFELFGIPRRLDVDEASLQQKYYELSRQFHPDKNPGSDALDATARINDAWRTFRDPVKRAEYLLTIEGFDIGEQRSKDVPPELLEEVFELNMMLEELREGDESTRPRLEEERGRFLEMLATADNELKAEFRRYDQARDRSVLSSIRGILNRRRYIQNLANEVEQAL